MRHSIEYLNARREAIRNGRAESKGKADRMVNPIDQRARDAEMDAAELLHENVRLVFADFRQWFAESSNALRAGAIADGDNAIPF
jgi:hypothetical protein